jgi:hypothetical protein
MVVEIVSGKALIIFKLSASCRIENINRYWRSQYVWGRTVCMESQELMQILIFQWNVFKQFNLERLNNELCSETFIRFTKWKKVWPQNFFIIVFFSIFFGSWNFKGTFYLVVFIFSKLCSQHAFFFRSWW